MSKMAIRPKLTVDCSTDLTNKIKIVGLSNGYPTLREFVLRTLAQKYPELKEMVDAELSRD